MTEKNYRLLTGILLATNVIFLIIIGVLCGEIFTLQEKLSEMTDIVRTLNDKISKIKAIQEETLLNQEEIFLSEKRIKTGNDCILISAAIILGIVVLMYFGGSGGSDPGIEEALDLFGDQLATDIATRNEWIDTNFKHDIDQIESVNRANQKVVTNAMNYIIKSLDGVISMISPKS